MMQSTINVFLKYFLNGYIYKIAFSSFNDLLLQNQLYVYACNGQIYNACA